MATNSEQKLLNKFHLTLSCLDYCYIGKSKNVKEIENILRVLRSGQEGIYPDLIKFCENRLRELSPNNKLLHVQKPAVCLKDLPDSEQKMLEKELMEWKEQIEQFSKATTSSEYLEKASPPVRKPVDIKLNEAAGNASGTSQNESSKFKPRTPLTYSSWDKFAVENEVKKIEESVQKGKDSDAKKCKIALQPFLDTSGLSDKEKCIIADKERSKGNEAFKAKDFAEAEIYYSRSISAFPTVAALNNRALASFKLKEYTHSLVDCNAVLSVEPNNVKALYRRGLVHKEMGSLQLAYMDFLNVLELEPKNKAAKEQIQKIEKNPCAISQPGKTPVIEEIPDAKFNENEESEIVSEPIVTEKNAHENSNPSNPDNKVELEKKDLISRLSPQTADFSISEHERLKGVEENSHDSYAKTTESDSVCLKKKHTVQKNKSEACGGSHEKSAEHKLVSIKIESVTSSISAQGNLKQVLRNNYDDCEIIQSNLSPSEYETVACLSKATYKKDEKPQNNESIIPSSDMLQDEYISGKLPCTKPSLDAVDTFCNITPFKFYTLWNCMGANNDSKEGAAILKKLLPKQLPEVISNKLDGDFLCGLIRAVTTLVQSGDVTKGYEIMSCLLEVPRIKIILCFLSSSERKEIEDLFLLFKMNGIEDCDNLKEIFLAC